MSKYKYCSPKIYLQNSPFIWHDNCLLIKSHVFVSNNSKLSKNVYLGDLSSFLITLILSFLFAKFFESILFI